MHLYEPVHNEYEAEFFIDIDEIRAITEKFYLGIISIVLVLLIIIGIIVCQVFQ